MGTADEARHPCSRLPPQHLKYTSRPSASRLMSRLEYISVDVLCGLLGCLLTRGLPSFPVHISIQLIVPRCVTT